MKREEGAEVSNCEGLDGNGDKEALLGQGRGSMREETGERKTSALGHKRNFLGIEEM